MYQKIIIKSFLIVIIFFLTWSSWSSSVSAATNNNGLDEPNAVNTKLEWEVLQIIRKHPEVIIESIQNLKKQEQEQQRKLRELFSSELKSNPQKIIAESPRFGTSGNEKIILEFADFQCFYCGQAHRILKEFMRGHQNEVVLVYKHLPLSPIHPEAMASAKAAWAAGQQGKFWQYHDALFEEQKNLGEALYLDIANNLNLNLEKFGHDRSSEEAKNAIQKDMELADRIGINGTPFFLVNGQFYAGAIPLSTLEEAL